MAVPVPLGTPELMSMAAALGWASGLRLYAVLFLVGLAGHLGWVPLPTGLQWLQQFLQNRRVNRRNINRSVRRVVFQKSQYAGNPCATGAVADKAGAVKLIELDRDI